MSGKQKTLTIIMGMVLFTIGVILVLLITPPREAIGEMGETPMPEVSPEVVLNVEEIPVVENMSYVGPAAPLEESSEVVDLGPAEQTVEEETVEVGLGPGYSETEETDVSEVDLIENHLGEVDFEFAGNAFHRYDLPDVYYPGIDFSYFQPGMSYKAITNKHSTAYSVVHSENAYVDEYGFLRYKRGENEFTVDGKDDYVIALGTFYKPKGVCGNRYYIVTSTGSYTATTGDEKADCDTDPYHLFSRHGERNQYAGVIEWLIDTSAISRDFKNMGTATYSGVEEIAGQILHIYSIN